MTGSTPPARAESKSATYAAESAAKKEEPGAAPDPPPRPPSMEGAESAAKKEEPGAAPDPPPRPPSMEGAEPKDYTGAPKQRTELFTAPAEEVGGFREDYTSRSILVGAAAAATTATVYGVLTNIHLNNKLRDALAIFRQKNIDFQLALEKSDISNEQKCATRTYMYTMRAVSTYTISELNDYQRGSELKSVKKSLDAITKTLGGNLSKENNEMQVAYAKVKNASDAARGMGVVYSALVVGAGAGFATGLVAYGVPVEPSQGQLWW
jgi:hypothetical protein